MHPIVVTQDKRLIAGRRRIEAYKELGRDENVCRGDFAPSDAVAIAEAIEAREKERQREHGGTAPGKRKNTCEKFTQVNKDESKSKQKAAKSVDM